MPSTRLTTSVGTLSFALACSLSNAFAGPTWDLDNTSDAKAGANDAQVVTTSSTVLSINGSLTGSPLVGDPDLVDMYLLRIDAPTIFSMSTAGGSQGGYAAFDSQLFLFRAEGVLGDMRADALLANHLANSGENGSFVGNSASNGTYVLTAPGLYYVAITAFGTDAFAASDERIWGAMTNPGEVLFGNNAALAYWNSASQTAGGAYSIRMSGITGVPAPAACALLALGGLIQRRRRN